MWTTSFISFMCFGYFVNSDEQISFKIVLLKGPLILLFNPNLSVFLQVGLFNDEDSQAEMAFRYGIDRFNMFKPEIHFEAVVAQASTYDSLEISKTLCDLAGSDNGIVAIFGPASPTTSTMAQSVCANLGLPYIHTNWKPVTIKSETMLNFYPDSEMLATATATLVKHMNWRSYSILYENLDSLVRLQEVFQVPDSTSSPVTLRQLNPDGDYRTLLKEIKSSKQTNIIVDCATDKIMNVLIQAKEMGLLDVYYSYLFTSLDAHILDFDQLDTNSNITLFRIIDPESSVINYAVRDWELGEFNRNRHRKIMTTELSTEAALMHDAINFFTTSFHELYTNEEFKSEALSCTEKQTWEHGANLVNYIKIKSMPNSLTGNMRFDDLGRRVDFTLDVIEILHGKIEKIATWSPEDGDHLAFIRSEHEQMKQIVQNLQKTLIIVSSRIGPPYLSRRQPEFEGEVLQGNAEFEGYSMDLIDGISKELNFTYLFKLAEDGKYGNYVKENHTWNGLIKDLIDRKAHLAICDLTITHARREMVDFSMPFMTLGVSILYSKSKPSERNIFAFMEPLENVVWIYIMCSVISVTLIMFAVTRGAPGDWEDPNPMSGETPEELENNWTFKNCMWLILGSTMSQGCDMLPKGISSRMAASMWWFFILIISSSYTANLAAFLTMDKMAPSIDSAEALSKQTKIKYGTVSGGSTETFFKESNFSTYQRMWVQMETTKPSVFEKSNVDGVKRVLNAKNQGYAFLMESSSIEYEIERNCDLKQVGGRMDSKGYGIAMPFNSPYRSAINKAILKMQEEGQLAILKKKWWKEMHGGGACDNADDGSGSSAELKLTNVGGVFLVLGISVVIALIFSVVDVLWNAHKISVKRHISFKGALKVELLFAVKVWQTKKPVTDDSSTKSLGISQKITTTQSQQTLANSSFSKNLSNLSKELKSLKSDTSCNQTI